jgi:Tol biopolymer transport system component
MRTHQLTRRFLIIAGFIAGAILTIVSYSTAQKVSESELQFREALHKQQVQGDLPAAIKLYQNIAASKTADRAVKARALLQLAACYEKLGQQSEAVYQQILRDFADQPAASQARVKLAALRPPASPSTQTLRKIELGPGVQNIVATDGQRAVYWDAAETTLFFGDVAGKSKNIVLTATAFRKPIAVVASRDLSMVALYFPESGDKPQSYAVVKTDGAGYSEINATVDGNAPLLHLCLSWSRDNRYILQCRQQADGVHLTKVSVADGQTIDLLPAGLKTVILGTVFSPDDRFIAFQDAKGSVYILPAKGAEPQLVAESATLVDWTEDGKYFVFAAEQGKTYSLFAVPVKDGRPAGDRIFIRRLEKMSGPVRYGSSLVYAVAPDEGMEKVSVVSIEGDRLGQWKTLDLVGIGGFAATFSPDATRIAYVSHAAVNDRTSAVRVHDVASGEDRELFRSNELLSICRWASQRPILYCMSQVIAPKVELLSISLETGRAEKIMTFDGPKEFVRLSPDDRILYMGGLSASGGPGLYQWEIGSGKPEAPAANGLGLLSFDGRWVATATRDSQGRRGFEIGPALGGNADSRHMVYVRRQAPPGINPIAFTPDGNWFLFHDQDPDGKDGLYRVSTSGGEAHRLGDYPTSLISVMWTSLDGRHILVDGAAATGKPSEYWLLQNFIPPTASAAKR